MESEFYLITLRRGSSLIDMGMYRYGDEKGYMLNLSY
jgi:hypothetical protein